jgi:hypothetical protein
MWKSKLSTFFSNETFDAELQDQFYEALIHNPSNVSRHARQGMINDPYTGLFTFDEPEIYEKITFNFAYFIKRNLPKFINKKILTFTTDTNIMNVQAKFCGLNVIKAITVERAIVGSVLTCVANDGIPYPINSAEFNLSQADVLFFSSVFYDDRTAYDVWNIMLDSHLSGKEVYFTTNTLAYLKMHMLPDRIQPCENPEDVYDAEDMSDRRKSYRNKIYKLI